MLDLSHVSFSEYNVARFARKSDAKAVASSRGWNACDVVQAFNRFQIFWVIGERLENNLRLAARIEGVIEVPYKII